MLKKHTVYLENGDPEWPTPRYNLLKRFGFKEKEKKYVGHPDKDTTWHKIRNKIRLVCLDFNSNILCQKKME